MLKLTQKQLENIENYSAFFISISSILCIITNYKIFEFSQYLIYYFIADILFFKKKTDIIINKEKDYNLNEMKEMIHNF